MEAPPISHLEEQDNSLFDYLCSLSALKTKRPVTTRTLNSLGMDYTLLTSPDATIYEDSTIFTRHWNHILNTSKPQVSPEDVNKIYSHEEALTDSTHACHYSIPRAMQYNPCSSEQRPLISAEEAKWALELLGMKVPNGTNVQDDSLKDSVACGSQVEANFEGVDCDYNNLISSITQSVNLLPQSTTNSNYKMQTVEPDASSSNPREPIAATDRNQTRNNLANVALRDSHPIVRGVDELACNVRSIMRPYQSYQPEMSSLQRNNYVYTSKSDEMNAINENPDDSQMCVLPRNDFYLKVHPALNNYKGIENDKMSSGRKPESPSCTSSLHFSASQGHHLLPVPAPMERYLEPSETENFTKISVHIPGEDFCRSTPDLMSRVQFNDLTNKLLDQNMKRTSKVHSKGSISLVSSGSEHEMEEESTNFCQNISTRKRKVKWSDLTGEGRACRSCRCKKSSCLKDYCGCFSAGVYCTGPCSCKDCLNNGDNEDTVLQARRKNDPKVEDPNKLQKKGCVCNKTSCQMKKCKCFKDGVGCSPSCKCQGCENIYGRKDSAAETKSELKETGAET